LEDAGLEVRVEAWDLQAGGNLAAWTGTQMAWATSTIALCSPAYFESHWCDAQWGAALIDGGRLLPLRVAACALPVLLAGRRTSDLFDADERTALLRLLTAVDLVDPRGQPTPFPGPTLPRAFPGRWPDVFLGVPPRLRSFTGRQDLLDAIATALAGGGDAVGGARAVGASTVVALHGLGGVGKSQLVVEYLHRHAAEYDLVLWCDAEDGSRLAAALAGLAGPLRLPPTGGVDGDAAAVLADLRGRARWLLVFDNAGDQGALRPWLPDGPGHVLITSRRRDWLALGRAFEVDVLARPEAIALLRRRLPTTSHPLADEVAAELGDLPLALEQAAAHVDAAGLTAAGYLARFRSQRRKTLARGEDLWHRGAHDRVDRAHRGTVAVLWGVTLERLEPEAADLLSVCAQLGPAPIPLDLLRQVDQFDQLEQGGAPAPPGPVDVDDAVDELVRYSLVRRGSEADTVAVHRLLAAVVRDQQPLPVRAAAAPHARRIIRRRRAIRPAGNAGPR
jgi:hypothetical protein